MCYATLNQFTVCKFFKLPMTQRGLCPIKAHKEVHYYRLYQIGTKFEEMCSGNFKNIKFQRSFHSNLDSLRPEPPVNFPGFNECDSLCLIHNPM